MFNKINIRIGFIIVAILLGLNSSGQITQFRQAHSRLLAKQERVSQRIALHESNQYARSLYGGNSEENIYSEHWNSKELISYGGVSVPDIKTISLGSYCLPVRNNTIIMHFGKGRIASIPHKGIDLKTAVGDTVKSVFSGKVRLTRFDRDGYGFYVVIRHENGLETIYGHLSKFLVKQDQYVKAGTPIGLSGNTGRSSGPHLHFEVRFMDIPVNPEGIFDFEQRKLKGSSYTFNKNSERNNNKPRVTSSRRRRK